jgi:Co/Zn/Cd efflux system component
MSTADNDKGSKKKLSLVGEIDDKDDAETPLLAKEKKKSDKNLRKLVIVTMVCFVFMVIEIIGGYIASSIA